MIDEDSNKLENVRDKVNDSRKKAEEVRNNVYNLRERLKGDSYGQEVGEYFAVESGYSDLTDIQEDLEEVGEFMKDKLGLAAYGEPEQAEQLLFPASDAPEDETQEIATEVSEIGDFHDEAWRTLKNTARGYMNRLAHEETEIYGDQELDELLQSEEQYYQNQVQKLETVGEKLEKQNFSESEKSSAKAAADD